MNIPKLTAGFLIAAMLVSSGPALAGDSELKESPTVEVTSEPVTIEVISGPFKIDFNTEMNTLKKDAAMDKHWVYGELAAFKQLMLPVIHSDSVTEENKNILRNFVFNRTKLDQAIDIGHWAFLLREALKLPSEKADQLLSMYAYGLSTGNEIKREDAVGGLVKLLTINYLRGQTSAGELEPAKALKDLDSVSERQSILVQKAYCEGILDATVKDAFRPKDSLTVTEAVSMLYKVMQKYNIDLNDTADKKGSQNAQQHWVDRELEDVINKVDSKAERIKGVRQIIQAESANQSVSHLDSPITVDKWNELLFNTLNLGSTKYEKNFLENYTYGLTKDKYITRASAVAGLVKLLHAAELVDWRDATEEEKAVAASYFTDYEKIWDQSKFSIAFAEGLIVGYENYSFRPEQRLTNGEALALMIRIINKYY